MGQPVIGVGASGHARVVMDSLWRMGGYEPVGLLDYNEHLWGTTLLGVPVLGYTELLPGLAAQGIRHAFIGFGSLGDPRPRQQMYALLQEHGFTLVNAIHPRATCSPFAEWGSGAIIMAGAVVNAAARLGVNVIVNTGAIVEHDCVIGDHVHIATGARLAGGVQVGSGAHIGIGASVIQRVQVGQRAVVGAGAVVVADVPERVVVVGVPARVVRQLDDG